MFFFKKTISLAFLALAFVIVSCNNEEEMILPDRQSTNSNSEIVNRSQDILSFDNCLQSHADMFEAQLTQFSRETESINHLLEPEVASYFEESLQKEMEELNTIGFSTYVSELENDGRVTTETAQLLNYIHAKMDSGNGIDIAAAKTELVSLYEPESAQTNYSDFYCYIYNIALTLYEQYESEGTLENRDKCKFKDFFQHVFESAVSGLGVGKLINEVWEGLGWEVIEWEISDNLTISVPGSVLGGTIGAIVGIFTFENECDCGQPQAVAITSDDDCDLTRTLQIHGAGADAAGYEWFINTGTQTVSFTTIVPFATVTQEDPSTPLKVEVRAICEDGPSDLSPEQEVDLNTAADGDLGAVGTLDLYFLGCGGPSGSMDCLNTDPTSFSIFGYSPAYSSSGHIEVECVVSPASIVESKTVTETSTTIKWAEEGTATISVTATNTCSGLTTTESLTVEIED